MITEANQGIYAMLNKLHRVAQPHATVFIISCLS